MNVTPLQDYQRSPEHRKILHKLNRFRGKASYDQIEFLEIYELAQQLSRRLDIIEGTLQALSKQLNS